MQPGHQLPNPHPRMRDQSYRQAERVGKAQTAPVLTARVVSHKKRPEFKCHGSFLHFDRPQACFLRCQNDQEKAKVPCDRLYFELVGREELPSRGRDTGHLASCSLSTVGERCGAHSFHSRPIPVQLPSAGAGEIRRSECLGTKRQNISRFANEAAGRSDSAAWQGIWYDAATVDPIAPAAFPG